MTKKTICNICYRKKKTYIITCCKGKKWCIECKNKHFENLPVLCPYCRTVLKEDTQDTQDPISLPRVNIPIGLNPSIIPSPHDLYLSSRARARIGTLEPFIRNE
jgi:hypothetical protein